MNTLLIQGIKARINVTISLNGYIRLSSIFQLLGIDDSNYTIDYKITEDDYVNFIEQADGSYLIDIDIPDQSEVPKWIPITEKHGRYLVTGKWSDLEIATYIKDTNQWAIGWHNKDIPKEIGVIAWMPLPEPYEGD